GLVVLLGIIVLSTLLMLVLQTKPSLVPPAPVAVPAAVTVPAVPPAPAEIAVRQTELEGDWQVIKAVLSGRDTTHLMANVRYNFQGEALVRTGTDGALRISHCTVVSSANPKRIDIAAQTLEPPSSPLRGGQ